VWDQERQYHIIVINWYVTKAFNKTGEALNIIIITANEVIIKIGSELIYTVEACNTTSKYSGVCYNERGGILSADVAHACA
jgi:hypothetical protein